METALPELMSCSSFPHWSAPGKSWGSKGLFKIPTSEGYTGASFDHTEQDVLTQDLYSERLLRRVLGRRKLCFALSLSSFPPTFVSHLSYLCKAGAFQDCIAVGPWK